MKPEYEQIKRMLDISKTKGGLVGALEGSFANSITNLAGMVRQLFTLEHEAKEAQHRYDTGEMDFDTAMSLRGRAISQRLILADIVGHEWPPGD